MATMRRDIGAGHHFIFDNTLVSQPNTEMFSPEFWQLQNKITGQAKGRGTTIFIEHEGQHWVLRHFKRGGLVGKILSDQYFFNGVERSRPFEEFSLLEYMRGEGLLVPVPVAARIHRRGLIYRGDLITLSIPNSRDLHHVLCQQPLSQREWHEVGRALARMHNCQVYHHDANIRNIMIDSDKQIWLIDFDRCSKRQGDSWKQGNLDRLLRSLHKEQAKNPIFHWKEDDWTACLNGYNELVKR
ncbi:3-deoxy-D-manno-octulosonic acid kinase [Alteromonas marina]|uniref:3-deoxy-D-manno-octulosonic acid kinase n=1 Tax=Alteromonas marina TaxID=203795 RepID=A0A0B3XZC6_9ALTE|nr:3-deoxy-D-manno-octulosonic acid kinase [Alteromonas marina]KHT46355.1 3-deoxy-D-manno-octulosonic acid kinase [Alteromonas marina]